MKRVALLVQYDGSNYSGWQRQKNANTVQEILEKAKILIDSIQNLSEPEMPAIGVKLENLKGLNLNIEDINATSTGIGVDIKEAEIQGDITIKGVRSGQRDSTEKKTQV